MPDAPVRFFVCFCLNRCAQMSAPKNACDSKDQEIPHFGGDDPLATERVRLRHFTQRMRRRVLRRHKSYARVPLQHLLRAGLLSLLSVVRLLWRGVLLTDPEYFFAYPVEISVTDKSKIHWLADNLAQAFRRGATFYEYGELLRKVPLPELTEALLFRCNATVQPLSMLT